MKRRWFKLLQRSLIVAAATASRLRLHLRHRAARDCLATLPSVLRVRPSSRTGASSPSLPMAQNPSIMRPCTVSLHSQRAATIDESHEGRGYCWRYSTVCARAALQQGQGRQPSRTFTVVGHAESRAAGHLRRPLSLTLTKRARHRSRIPGHRGKSERPNLPLPVLSSSS